MKILGVTGGIGSGKSVVSRMLAESGARVFYADDEAANIMVNNKNVVDALRKAFGAETFYEDGSLNRPYVAGRIFSSDADRRTINQIVHPAVGDAFRRFCESARLEGVALVVKEAAILFENETSDLDAILVVDAKKKIRIDRVEQRDGLSKAEIKSRMKSQMKAGEMRKRADYVIKNNGTLEDLREAVNVFLGDFRAEI